MFGGVLSEGIRLNVQLALLPLASVAVNVTVVVEPMDVPATGDCVMTGVPPQLSDAVAKPV